MLHRDTDNIPARACSGERESESRHTREGTRLLLVRCRSPVVPRNENLTERAGVLDLDMMVRAFSVYGPRRGANNTQTVVHAGLRDRTPHEHTFTRRHNICNARSLGFRLQDGMGERVYVWVDRCVRV